MTKKEKRLTKGQVSYYRRLNTTTNPPKESFDVQSYFFSGIDFILYKHDNLIDDLFLL